MTTKTKVLIGITSALAVGGVLYVKVFSIPRISIEQIDRIKKTAIIEIGSKTVTYKFDTKQGMEIGKVSPLYTAHIEPAFESTDGATKIATIVVERNGQTRATKKINF